MNNDIGVNGTHRMPDPRRFHHTLICGTGPKIRLDDLYLFDVVSVFFYTRREGEWKLREQLP